MILGYFKDDVLDAAQGIQTRVYPSLLENGRSWPITRWRRVINPALIEACSIAVVIASTPDLPTNGGTVFLSSRLHRATGGEKQ